MYYKIYIKVISSETILKVRLITFNKKIKNENIVLPSILLNKYYVKKQ